MRKQCWVLIDISICELVFLGAPSFLPSPVTAGHPPFQLSWSGTRTPLEFLSYLCNTCIFPALQLWLRAAAHVSPELWHIAGEVLLLPGRGGGAAGAPAHAPGDPGLARVSPGTGMLRGHFSGGSAASHQHGGSTLLVQQVHTVLEASKRMYLSLYVYTHGQIRSQTKHYE